MYRTSGRLGQFRKDRCGIDFLIRNGIYFFSMMSLHFSAHVSIFVIIEFVYSCLTLFFLFVQNRREGNRKYIIKLF